MDIKYRSPRFCTDDTPVQVQDIQHLLVRLLLGGKGSVALLQKNTHDTSSGISAGFLAGLRKGGRGKQNIRNFHLTLNIHKPYIMPLSSGSPPISFSHLPKELSAADEGRGVLELPSHDVGPLVEPQGQVSVAPDPLGGRWREGG